MNAATLSNQHAPEVFRTQGPAPAERGPLQKHQHRVGLLAVIAGAEIPHKLTIDLPVHEPDHSTRTARRARSVVDKNKFIWGENALDIPIGAPAGTHGTPCPTHVRKGNFVIQGLVDGTRDEAFDNQLPDGVEPHKVLKVACGNPACSGKRWDNVDAMRRAHPTDQEMKERAEAHPYYGVIEIPEVKDPKTAEVRPAVFILASV